MTPVLSFSLDVTYETEAAQHTSGQGNTVEVRQEVTVSYQDLTFVEAR